MGIWQLEQQRKAIWQYREKFPENFRKTYQKGPDNSSPSWTYITETALQRSLQEHGKNICHDIDCGSKKLE